MAKILVGLCVLFAAVSGANAAVLAEWTFETSVPTTAGPHAAEGGLNAGAASPASGLHGSGSVVYSNPVGNGSTESFSSNFWATGDYYQFATSTVGYNAITIAWNQTRSSTGPATFDLEWSTNGATFTTLLNDYTVLTPSWSSAAPDATLASVFGPVAGPAALDNMGTVYFRLTSQVTPATGGTSRIDNVIISGTLIPEPATMVLLGLGGLMLRGRKIK